MEVTRRDIYQEVDELSAKLYQLHSHITQSEDIKRAGYREEVEKFKLSERKITDAFMGQIENYIDSIFSQKVKEAGKELFDAHTSYLNISERKYAHFIDKVSERLEHVESYLKKDKFHDILNELTKLEDEFHARAIALVSGVSKPTKSTKRGKK